MATVTLKGDDQTIKKIIHFYKDYQIENNNPYATFVAKSNDTTITIYTSKKVVFQGKNAEYEASIFGKIETKTTANDTTSKKIENTHSFYLPSVGSDEVGTGDYFGPVVVVAAYVDDDSIEKLKHLKLADSKTLTDEQIRKEAPTLFKTLPYSLLIVRNEKYNAIMKGSMNMNKLKAILHKQAITNLFEKLGARPTFVIDAFCTEKNFVHYTNDPHFLNGCIFTTKAESKYLSVACASMMARYQFLFEMDKLSARIGEKIEKGAGGRVDAQGKRLVQIHGKEILSEIAKLHFKNTDKIL